MMCRHQPPARGREGDGVRVRARDARDAELAARAVDAALDRAARVRRHPPPHPRHAFAASPATKPRLMLRSPAMMAPPLPRRRPSGTGVHRPGGQPVSSPRTHRAAPPAPTTRARTPPKFAPASPRRQIRRSSMIASRAGGSAAAAAPRVRQRQPVVALRAPAPVSRRAFSRGEKANKVRSERRRQPATPRVAESGPRWRRRLVVDRRRGLGAAFSCRTSRAQLASRVAATGHATRKRQSRGRNKVARARRA